ncbi:MAG: acyl-ACP--UDP-N-acetylglucosamine O-acyltransferase [Caulobacteraceae bacterium]
MNIHPTAQVSTGAEIGEDVEIGPYCIVGARVKLGRGVVLRSHVVIDGDTELGEGCEVWPFAVLGGPPQHTAHKKSDPSRLVVGAHNLIREQVTMHGGSVAGIGVTRVGDDCDFYVGAHVGHDCVVGDKVILTNGATLGGHVRVGEHVIISGLSAVQQRGRIGRHAFVGGVTGVTRDLIPFGMAWGDHARLDGLNLTGLKRRGFSREEIHTLRAAYRMLFAGEGAFQDRLAATADTFAHSSYAMEIVDFIRAEPTRPLVLPAGQGAA